MSKKVKISKLVLEIGGKKIELSMKQAKELQEVLNDSFGDTEIVFRDRWYRDWYTQKYTATSPNVYLSQLHGATCTDDRPQQTHTGEFQGASFNGNLNGNTMTLTAQ